MNRRNLSIAALAVSGLWALAGLFASAQNREVADPAAGEKKKVEVFLKHLDALEGVDAARKQAFHAKWARLKDKGFDTESDFIVEALADIHPAFGDALDLIDGGAYTTAVRKLNDAAAGARDAYLEVHVRYYLARIKFSEGDWAGAARDLAELLEKNVDKMTLEHEAYFYHARALANIAPKEERKAVAERFARFLEKYPYSKQRYLAAARDLAAEVARTLPVIRQEGLTKVNGGIEEFPNFGKDLQNIEKRISVPVRDTGKVTQKLQSEALAYLDNLIDQIEDMQNQQLQQQQKNKDKDKDKDGKDKDGKDKDGKDKKDDKDQTPEKVGDPRDNSNLPSAKNKAGGTLKSLKDLQRGNFGTLPPEAIEKIIQEALRDGRIPEKYRKAMELYSEELGRRELKKKTNE
jgi:hypothetical protein